MWFGPVTLPSARPDPSRRATARAMPRRRGWRVGPIEALEGRALLASAVAPTFNGGQPAITAIGDSGATLSRPAAVAVQSDGKLVVVGTNDMLGSAGIAVTSTLSVARYNTDGTLDATFGTGGRATIALPVPTGVTSRDSTQVSVTNVVPAGDVLIQPDGKIVVDANIVNESLATSPDATIATVPVASVAIRLTSGGVPDATFGTNGQVKLTAAAPEYERLALQGDGKIVLAGSATTGTGTTGTTPSTAVTRLDADGTVDTAFNSGNPLVLGANSDGLSSNPAVVALGVQGGGQIKVVTRTTSTGSGYVVNQITAAGALDPAFGTGGTVTAPSGTLVVHAATVTPDGGVLIATQPGDVSFTILVRLNADGSPAATINDQSGTLSVATLAVAADGSILLGGSGFEVQRLRADGSIDPTFGPRGMAGFSIPDLSTQFPGLASAARYQNTTAVVPAANGQVAVVGFVNYATYLTATPYQLNYEGSQGVVALLGATNRTAANATPGDYDGDGKSDIAAELAQFGAFAYRKSTGGDVIQSFGAPGAGQTIPAPGDYDGDGKTDIAAYLPAYGVLAYRPSSGGADVLVRFGPAGVGNAIPVPGDYDGDGKTDVALFLPGSATYAIDPSGGGAPYAVQFGAPGAGRSIPVPGDFSGVGRTELAVYIPVLGEFFYRDPVTHFDLPINLGTPGQGNVVPIAGDYNGDGVTDLATYTPSTATFAIYASNGFVSGDNTVRTPTSTVQFGAAGVGVSEPIVGDFDGDGRADVAVYIPILGEFAYRPSGGGADVLQPFGTGGTDTVPDAALPGNSPTTPVTSMALPATDPAANLVFYLPTDLPGTTKPKSGPTATA